MKKIPTLFMRDFAGNPELVTTEPNPLCQWVFEGCGTASIKRDGTACCFQNGALLKRYDARRGKSPDRFQPCQEPDELTGHWPGWLPIGPDDKWHLWYLYQNRARIPIDGTYELCGPKVQNNPEGFTALTLIPHGCELINAPRNYDALKEFFGTHEIEGVVFSDSLSLTGNMCKIKRSDFGLKWPVR